MTFPDAPLGHRIELDVNGAWTDITSYADHGPVQIGRGHPDESTTVSPSTLGGLELTNNDGRFTSLNPTGPYYPYLVRNIPLRVSVPAQSSYLRLEGDDTSYASCPDATGLQITGDLDLRIDLRLSDWQPCTLAARYGSGAAEHAWWWLLNGDGTMWFGWAASGGGSFAEARSAALPFSSARTAIRVTLQVSTGTVTFWTSDTISGTWTQLGDAVVPSGAPASLNAGTGAPVAVGYSAAWATEGWNGVNGRVYEFRVLSGIGGTLEADPVFSAQTAGATSFSDSAGNTWTLSGTAEISDRDYRGYFEVPEWPQHSGAAGKSVTVAIAGGALLRRHSQRTSPLDSAIYRAWIRVTAGVLAAYWPMEDGANASQLASASGGAPMYFSGGPPQLASSSVFVCSGALPVLNGAALSGDVSWSGTWTDNQVAFLIKVPSGGEANGAPIATVTTTGTVASLVLTYLTTGGGSLQLTGYSSSGAQVFQSGTLAFSVNGTQFLLAVALQDAGGGNITWHVDAFSPGAASQEGVSATVSGTVGAVTRVQLDPAGTLTQTVTGHCAVLAQYESLYTLDSYTTPAGTATGVLSAWAGEPAGVRFARLCAEEGIAFRCRGDLDVTVAMGNQSAQTLVQLLQECADADRGVWYELRQALGWGYITRSALYNQAAAVTADYNADDLDLWPADPLEDDQTTVNDVTVTNSGTSKGSSARQYAAPGQPVTGGRLSTLSPPDGIGTYDQSYSVNLAYDGDLDSEAGWILHVGTVDQPRYPGIGLSLDNRDLAALFWDVLDMDLGDRLVIDNPPVWLGPDPVSQLCQQISETFWSEEYSLVITGVPELPYQVAAEGAAHADTGGCALCAAVNATATALLAASAGIPWTTDAADFPFDLAVAGERVTVTAAGNGASGTLTSPGTFAYLASCALPPGTWTIAWTVTLSGTVGSPEADNFILTAEGWAGGSTLATSVNAGAAGTYVQATAAVTVPAGATATVNVKTGGSTPTSGSVYGGIITSPQTLTVTRAVNGVSKAQSAGAAIALWNTPAAAL